MLLHIVIVGPVIYFVEQNQVANQATPAQDVALKSLPHASESLRNNGTTAPFAATVNAPITPEPSTISSDPVIVAIALAGAAVCIFAVFFGIRIFAKFRK